MYTSLEIKGFRCFKHLKIDKLARFNLIGGKNNTGKTALLEAIWFGAMATDPDTAVSDVYRNRGVDARTLHGLGFGDLFLDLDDDGGSEATVSGEVRGQSRAVVLQRSRPERSVMPITDGEPGNDAERWQLVFRIGSRRVGSATLAHGEVVFVGRANTPSPPCVFLPSRQPFDQQHLAGRFSDLRVRRQDGPLLELLRRIEPRLNEVTVESVGGQPVLYADLGGERLAPFPFGGEGMLALCALLLGLTDARDGALLVDEIENGLHYSAMADVWRAITQAAKDLDVQVFATTHSYECVRAAQESVEEVAPGEFLYHRLDRVDDGIECQTYSPRGLEIAVKTGTEFR